MHQTRLDNYDNRWFNPGRSALIRILWYYTNLLIFKNPFIPTVGLKRTILRLFGASVGKGVIIKPDVNIKYPWNLSIGDHAWIGEGVWIDSLTTVTIGAHACLSQGAMLLTGSHNYKKTTFDLIVQEIVLEDGVWIGAQSVVCPGVTCRSHSVLAVQSVATKELKPYAIYQGNPAEYKRERKIIS